MRTVFTFCLLLAICSACHIEQRYVFQRDFSGDFTHIMDFSDSEEMIPKEDLQKDGDSDSGFLDSLSQSGIVQELEKMEGIHQIKLSEEDAQVSMSASFDGIDALNRLLSSDAMGRDDIEQFCQFKKKGRKIIVDFDTSSLEKPKEDEMEPDSLESAFDMDQSNFDELITYHFSYTFEQGVQSVRGTSATISDDGKTVTVNETLKSLSEEDFDPRLVIKLKK